MKAIVKVNGIAYKFNNMDKAQAFFNKSMDLLKKSNYKYAVELFDYTTKIILQYKK